MSRITKDLEELLMARKPALFPGWVPLVVLPAAALFCSGNCPRWVLMWMLALAIGLGCKWLTWWEDGRGTEATGAQAWVYLFAWPGMNAREVLSRTITSARPPNAEWFFAGMKTYVGAAAVWVLVRRIPAEHELLAGWVGLVG